MNFKSIHKSVGTGYSQQVALHAFVFSDHVDGEEREHSDGLNELPF